MTGSSESGHLFGEPRVSDVSLQAKIVELEREIGYRKRVYNRLVGKRRMTRRQAEERILVMRAILEDYYCLNQAQHEHGKPSQ